MLVWSELDPKRELQASALPKYEFSSISESLFHWSVKATDCERGDGGKTKFGQTVAIWETTVSCVPEPPHHFVKRKGPIIDFCPLVFS